jgi:methylamine dehydrogenase accessory protein MauD
MSLNEFLFISNLILWLALLFLGFLLLGTLRSLGLLQWRLDQLQATMPTRIGREGLIVGATAPEFRLPNAAGREVSLRQYRGRNVLLVFTQSGCGPCEAIVPELLRVQERGKIQVLVVNHGSPAETGSRAAEINGRFPVLGQEKWSLSKSYQVYATPFAFLIDELGIITGKGIVGSRQYLNFVLRGETGRQSPSAVPGNSGSSSSDAARGKSPSTEEVSRV